MPSHQIGSFKRTLKYLLNRFPVPVPKMVGRNWWLSHPLQFRWKTEAHVLSWAEQVLCEGDTVIDVGAHAGWVSLASSGIVGSTGHVVAIEPSPPLASLIRYHRTINLASSIVVEEFAATDSRGVADFFICNRGLSSINSLSESSVAREAPPGAPVERIRVNTITLDDYCELNKLIPSLIKIDVEGAELVVIRGASTILARHKPALILAVHPPLMPCGGETELFDLLHDYRYVLRDSRKLAVESDVWGDYLLT